MEVHQKRSGVRAPSMRKVFRFFEEIKSEFHKIQWTEGEEVVVYAKVVVLATFVLGMAIYFADLIIQRTLLGLEVVFKLLFG